MQTPSDMQKENETTPPRTGDLNQMSKRLSQFNRERDWEQFHCPRNLAMALCVEAGELLECFLWSKDDAGISDDQKEKISQEAADVLICLLNLCRRAGIDLPQAFENKLAQNEKKYPPEKARGRCEKYDKL